MVVMTDCVAVHLAYQGQTAVPKIEGMNMRDYSPTGVFLKITNANRNPSG